MKHLRDKENKNINNLNLKERMSNVSRIITQYTDKMKDGSNFRRRVSSEIANEFAKTSKNNSKENTVKDSTFGNVKKMLDWKKDTSLFPLFPKKNQVVLVATALMLVTAGYLNYTNNIKIAALGDAKLVNANVVSEENVESKDELEEEAVETSISNEENIMQNLIVEEDDKNDNNIENSENTSTQEAENTSQPQSEQQENAIKTSSKINDSEYFTKTKLEREKMYSQMLETYQKILENSNIPNDQKSIASNEIKNINNKKTAISTIENLIRIKGFEDVALLINENSINIVVKSSNNLEPAQVAQIQNIISRELQADIEDIHITTHS